MIEKNPDVFAPVSANGEVVSFNSHMVVSFRFLTVFAPFEAASWNKTFVQLIKDEEHSI